MRTKNLSLAAREAGYTGKYTAQTASKALKKPHVEAYCRVLLSRVKPLSEAELKEFWSDMLRTGTEQGKLRASELLAKANGVFKDSGSTVNIGLVMAPSLNSELIRRVDDYLPLVQSPRLDSPAQHSPPTSSSPPIDISPSPSASSPSVAPSSVEGYNILNPAEGSVPPQAHPVDNDKEPQKIAEQNP